MPVQNRVEAQVGQVKSTRERARRSIHPNQNSNYESHGGLIQRRVQVLQVGKGNIRKL